MSTNHNRIKVADLEKNQPNKILKTNQNGELEFSDATNLQTETYNALDCTTEGRALDARQGKVLKEMIENVQPQIIQDASANQYGIINTTSLQELGGADKTINGVRIGKGAGNEITNTVLGHDSLFNNTTEGYCNTAIGYASLQSNIDGCENTAIGDKAGLNNISGVANTFIGEVTGWNNTIGNDNTALGAGALKENISGSNNTAIGSLAGDSLITGSNNTIIGRPSGISSNDSNLVVLADGAGNYALKKEADNRLLAPTLTNDLIDAGGNKSLITKEYLMPQLASKLTASIATDEETQIKSAVTEDNKVVSRSKLYNWWEVIKSQAQTISGKWNFTGIPTAPTALAGTNTKQIATTEFVKTAVNNIPIPVIKDVSENQSGVVNNTTLQELGGADKTINGIRIGKGNNSIITNTALGYLTLNSNTTGNQNTAVGIASLMSNTTGNTNTAVGRSSLGENTTGCNNTAAGHYSLYFNTTGEQNTALGARALFVNNNGCNNIAVGHQAGSYLTSGSNNLLIENITGQSITTGNNNIVLNPIQKTGIVTGSNNTIIGGYDGVFNSTDSDLVVLGNGAGVVAIRKESNNRLLAPTLTNALIDAGGNQSLVTLGYFKANSAVNVVGIYPDNATALSNGKKVGDVYRKATGELMIVF